MHFEYFILTRRVDPMLAWLNSHQEFNAGVDFPSEMFEEILSRVDVKQLCTFQLLNKDLNNLISSKYFKLKHFEHMQDLNNAVFFFQEEALFPALYYHVDSVENDNNGRLISAEDKDIEVLASSGGMLLFCDRGDDFYLYNPITTAKHTLPTCKTVFPAGFTHAQVYYSMGYVSSDDDYKIVRVSVFNSIDTKNEVMVYSRNTGEWVRAPSFPGDSPTCQSGVFMHGKLHWRSSKASPNYCITSFNLSDGTYHKFPMPNVPFLRGVQQLVALDCTTLALASCQVLAQTTHSIWILMDYNNDQSWSRVDIDFGDRVELKLSTVDPLCFIKPGRIKILFRINPSGNIVIYDMITKKFGDVGADEVSGGYVCPFLFYPTLHSPWPVGN